MKRLATIKRREDARIASSSFQQYDVNRSTRSFECVISQRENEEQWKEYDTLFIAISSCIL